MRDRSELVKKQNFHKRERALSERVHNNTRTFAVSLSLLLLLLINIANGNRAESCFRRSEEILIVRFVQ